MTMELLSVKRSRRVPCHPIEADVDPGASLALDGAHVDHELDDDEHVVDGKLDDAFFWRNVPNLLGHHDLAFGADQADTGADT